MKKYKQFIIIIALTVSISQSMFSSNNPSVLKSDFQNSTILLEDINIRPEDTKPKKRYIIFFGNLLYGCSGFGICNVIVIEENNRKIPNDDFSAIATLSKNERGNLEFFFADKDINQLVKKTYLGDKYLIIGSNYKIEGKIISEIGFKNNFVIKEGKYILNRVKDGYSVSFN
jgi:ssDNA-binding Zn-finger/Zn-ribbon topoisomerase 1